MIDGNVTQQTRQWQIASQALTTLSYRSNDLSTYLNEISCAVSQFLTSDWSIVTLHDGADGRIVASSLDMGGTEIKFSTRENIADRVVQSRQPLYIKDARHHPEESRRMQGYACYLGVPIQLFGGKIVGTLCSFSMQPRHYDAETIAIVKIFAERASIAMDHDRLYQQEQAFAERLDVEITKRTMDLRAAQVKLVEYERLAAVAEFASMIVHEIRNPLATIQMGLDYFAKLALSQPARIRLTLALDESERLIKLLQEILSYSKPQIFRLSEINISELLQELLPSMRSMPEAQGRLIEYSPTHESLYSLGDPSKLKQVFINLIRNACRAVAEGETIRWSIVENPMGQICIFLRYHQSASLSTDILSRMSQPFYSTRPEAAGLELAIAKRIVEAHNGEFLVESMVDGEMVLRIQLPAKRNSTHNASSKAIKQKTRL